MIQLKDYLGLIENQIKELIIIEGFLFIAIPAFILWLIIHSEAESQRKAVEAYQRELKIEQERKRQKKRDELLQKRKHEIETDSPLEKLLAVTKKYSENDSIDECKIEDSDYVQILEEIYNPTFNKIRKVSIRHINNLCNSNEIFDQLDRGTKILDAEDELYQYMVSYGKMHKSKLYETFNSVIYKLDNQSINIIDWGCGQALATMLLVDYIKEEKFDIAISNIILIEPSLLALGRGLLHVDILRNNNINIKAINKDIDSIKTNDLIINNSNITLHLFSNILDIEFFKLDRKFLKKIDTSQKGLNYFICVSPNINDKRNSRLDRFYKYFM